MERPSYCCFALISFVFTALAFTPPIIAVEGSTIDTYAMIFILKVFIFSLIPSDMWGLCFSMISSSICSAVLLLGLV
jgi:hypothetical protein